MINKTRLLGGVAVTAIAAAEIYALAYVLRTDMENQQAATAPTHEAAPAAQKKSKTTAKAKTPSPKPRASAAPGISHTQPDEKGVRYFVTGGDSYKVTPDVYNAFTRSGLPVNGLLATAARESGLNPNSINKESGACGLFQFMTNKTGTLYEALYNHGTRYGYNNFNGKNYVAMVERTFEKDDNGKVLRVLYAPKAGQQAALIELCKNPTFNTQMHTAYIEPKVRKYEQWLGTREITTGEFVLLNNIGVGGLKKFAQQAWDNKKSGKDMLAHDFFASMFNMDKFKANRTLLYHPDKTPMTVRESYNRVFQEHGGGWGELRTQGLTQTASFQSPAGPK